MSFSQLSKFLFSSCHAIPSRFRFLQLFQNVFFPRSGCLSQDLESRRTPRPPSFPACPPEEFRLPPPPRMASRGSGRNAPWIQRRRRPEERLTVLGGGSGLLAGHTPGRWRSGDKVRVPRVLASPEPLRTRAQGNLTPRYLTEVGTALLETERERVRTTAGGVWQRRAGREAGRVVGAAKGGQSEARARWDRSASASCEPGPLLPARPRRMHWNPRPWCLHRPPLPPASQLT